MVDTPSSGENRETIAGTINKARNGSAKAFGRIAELSYEYLLMHARRELEPELRSKVGARDLVQEALLYGQRRIGTFRGQSEPELLAWLRRILRNRLSNYRRRYYETQKRGIYRETSLQDGDGQDLLNLLVARGGSASQCAVRREEKRALQRALLRLPEKYYLTIVWRYLDSKPFAEIARALNCSADAARKLSTRALKRLQDEVKSTSRESRESQRQRCDLPDLSVFPPRDRIEFSS